MFHFIAKFLTSVSVSLGLAAAALAPTATTTVSSPANPITTEEIAVNLHDEITNLRTQAERQKLAAELPYKGLMILTSRGDNVKRVQEILSSLNFLNTDGVTGYYGSLTSAAVKDFQKYYELGITGMVDEATFNKLVDLKIDKENLTDIYFPEEVKLLGIATSSDAILAGNGDSSVACPDMPQPIIVYQCPPADGTAVTQVAAPVTKTLAVVGSSYTFTPKTLSVAKGTVVTIHYTVTTGSHSFVIDALNVKVATTTSALAHDVTFTATTTGSFIYYSNITTDKQSGMTGTLTVTP